MPGRTLAIGDIHGCDRALDVLLDAVAPAAEDTLVVLGDVVDRGPGTKQAVDRLLELQDACRLVFILGNHEEMMLEALDTGEWMDDWLSFGGRETIDSYGGAVEDVPAEHREFLARGLDYWQTDSEIFVHAGLDPDLALERQPVEILRWTRISGIEPPHPSGKRVVCGHSSQKSGVPLLADGWICIDTFAYGGQFLTALDVEADRLWQAHASGRVREFTVDDLRKL